MSSFKAARRQKSVTALATLEGLDEAALRQQWVDCYGHPPPARLSRALLLRAVAYHQQSTVFGGLNGHLRRRLATLAVDSSGSRASGASPLTRLAPGTQLVREWQGQVHRVQVTDSGFEYRANTYRSLSHIARHITGTSWSGPAFFGLKHRPSAQVVDRG